MVTVLAGIVVEEVADGQREQEANQSQFEFVRGPLGFVLDVGGAAIGAGKLSCIDLGNFLRAFQLIGRHHDAYSAAQHVVIDRHHVGKVLVGEKARNALGLQLRFEHACRDGIVVSGQFR